MDAEYTFEKFCKNAKKEKEVRIMRGDSFIFKD